jgi:hypothetical protein
MSAEASREALARARAHLARAQEDPEDPDNVFVWSFWALENAITAAAIHADVAIEKQHWAKAEAARKLHKQVGLEDVSDLLRDLNDARKSTAYGDTAEPELVTTEVLAVLAAYIDAVAIHLTKPKPKKKTK